MNTEEIIGSKTGDISVALVTACQLPTTETDGIPFDDTSSKSLVIEELVAWITRH
jgi:hypothetical protein